MVRGKKLKLSQIDRLTKSKTVELKKRRYQEGEEMKKDALANLKLFKQLDDKESKTIMMKRVKMMKKKGEEMKRDSLVQLKGLVADYRRDLRLYARIQPTPMDDRVKAIIKESALEARAYLEKQDPRYIIMH